jgi:hypothetical protein
MTQLKGCFRRLEVKIGSCIQCTYYEHDPLSGKYLCNHPNYPDDSRELVLHNVMYIVPQDCPLENWYKVKEKQIDPEDEVAKLLWDMDEVK